MVKNDYTPKAETTSRNSYPIRSRLAMMLIPAMALAGGCTTLSPQGEQLLQGLAVGAASSAANQAAANAVGGQRITVNGGYQGQAQALEGVYVDAQGKYALAPGYRWVDRNNKDDLRTIRTINKEDEREKELQRLRREAAEAEERRYQASKRD